MHGLMVSKSCSPRNRKSSDPQEYMHLERKTRKYISHDVILPLCAEEKETQNSMGFSPILIKGKRVLKDTQFFVQSTSFSFTLLPCCIYV